MAASGHDNGIFKLLFGQYAVKTQKILEQTGAW